MKENGKKWWVSRRNAIDKVLKMRPPKNRNKWFEGNYKSEIRKKIKNRET